MNAWLAVEQWVLGSLLEKQVTVPATYPLTLNALRTGRYPLTRLMEGVR